MLYPQKGSMAKGSRRRLPTAPAAAAVVSEAMIDPRNTPWSQSRDWNTSGTTEARRPPKRMASIGTPLGSSHSEAMAGSWEAGTVKRALGWAAVVPESGDQSSPFHDVRWSGVSSVMPSHHTSPSSVRAVLVKMALPANVIMALGLVWLLVPGATPKNPASGLMACRRPSGPNFIQQMSSPTVSTFQSGRVGMSMARLVLPQAAGKAPV